MKRSVRTSSKASSSKASSVARLVSALALVALFAQPASATGEFHQDARGNPFHLVGHLLAPVGNAFGFLVVDPFYWVVDHVPALFHLD